MIVTEEPDYILDIGSQTPRPTNRSPRTAEVPQPNGGSARSGPVARPYLSVLFECCHLYQRIYKNKAGTAYEGRCPRCLKQVRIPIGQQGTSDRFFRAR